MLSAARRKLNSSAGASIVIALLFFLLCAVVGGVVLTAATVSAGKSAGDLRAQRAYLAVSSAARLIEADMEGESFSGSYSITHTTVTTITPTGDTDDDGQPTYTTTVTEDDSYSADNANDVKWVGQSKLIPASGFDLTDIYYSRLADPKARALWPQSAPTAKTCTLVIDCGDKGLPEVNATFTVDTSYVITVALQDVGGSAAMLLTFLPAETQPAVSSTATTSNESGNSETQQTTSVHTTTVTWGEAVISRKGAAK